MWLKAGRGISGLYYRPMEITGPGTRFTISKAGMRHRTRKSTRLAISAVWFSFFAVAPADYFFRYILISFYNL